MDKIYLIYGSNYGLIKKEVDKICTGYTDVVRYDLNEVNVSLALDEASCISLFGENKIIIGENANFLSNLKSYVEHDINYLLKYISFPNELSTVIFTIVTDKLDERKKVVKELRKNAKVIYKESINEKDLSSFVVNEFKNNGLKIDRITANYFISYVGNNVDIILSEIEKMKLYEPENNTVRENDINLISSKALKDNVFELVDAIMKKQYKKIYECYKDLMIINEEPIKIISLLATQFSFLYQVKLLNKNGKDAKLIAEYLGVHPYRVKLALETDFMIYEIEEYLKKLHNLDFSIKKGESDKYIGLEKFLLEV